MVRLYYSFDAVGQDQELLDMLGKKPSRLAHRTRLVDNFSRIYKRVVERAVAARQSQLYPVESLSELIASEFLLDGSLSFVYAELVFFCSHKFEVHRKRFAPLSFSDWSVLASSIMSNWMGSTARTAKWHATAAERRRAGGEPNPSDLADAFETTCLRKFFVGLDPLLVHVLHELKGRIQVDSRIRNEVRLRMERRSLFVRSEKSDRMSSVIKSIFTIAGNIGYEKELRDLWFDIHEKVCEPCIEKLGIASSQSLSVFVEAVSECLEGSVTRDELEIWRRFCAVVRDSCCLFAERCVFD